MLSEHASIDTDTAFDRLRSYARNRNMRLSEVATQVVDANLAAGVMALPTDRNPRTV